MAQEVTELYNIFIGHNWENSEHIHKVSEELDKMKQIDEKFDFLNQSNFDTSTMESTEKADLNNALRDQLEKSDVALILTDLYLENSEWLDKEIAMASEMNLPVIVVRSWDQKETPPELEEKADDVVYFEPKTIIQSIRQVAQGELIQ